MSFFIDKIKSLTILDYQNISLFSISTASIFSYVYYNYFYDITPFKSTLCSFFTNQCTISGFTPYEMMIPFVGLHAFIDFFMSKTYDLKLHHVCILGIIGYNYYFSVALEDRIPFLQPLLNTEVSSLFYVFKYWIPKNSILFQINAVLFYTTFFKFRIYDFYNKIVLQHGVFENVFVKYSNSNVFASSVLLISCYGLFMLNLYWFLIIQKILYKSLSKFFVFNTDVICHFLCSYIHWINVPLSICIYTRNPHEKYLLDIMGILFLSVSSYTYHYDIYNRLSERKMDNYLIPNEENIVFFMNDSLSIHTRSFLVVATNYYNSPNLLSISFISGLSHLSCFYHVMRNILELFIDPEETKETFMYCHNILMTLPIMCDAFLISINSPKEISIPFLFVNIFIGLLYTIEPFYKLTHAFFHICLIAQNYYLCLSNTR